MLRILTRVKPDQSQSLRIGSDKLSQNESKQWTARHSFDGLCLHYDISSNVQFKRAKPSGLPQKRLMTKNIGMLLLAIYLILVGITTLFHIGIGAIVMGVLALVTGILILVGK
jgi:uncharacterized membrane-anchored protein